MTKRSAAILLSAIILSSVPVYAISYKGLLGVGAEFGGDRLLSVTYSDGSTSDILAGQGLTLFGGVAVSDLLAFGPIAIDLQGTVGVKYSTIQEATNANANFFRFPLELLAYARWKGLRIGLGPAYHFANSFSGSGALAGYSFSLDNALGLTVQIDYLFLRHWGVGARYTSISYQPELAGATQKSGSNFGGELSYYF
jgi:hypothetical protein